MYIYTIFLSKRAAKMQKLDDGLCWQCCGEIGPLIYHRLLDWGS